MEDLFPRYAKIKDRVLKLNPLPDGQEQVDYDLIIDYAIEKVLWDVSNYTNVEVAELPVALDMVIISLVNNVLMERAFLKPADGDGQAITSISEGDTSVSYRDPVSVYKTLSGIDTVTSDYRSQLNKFRVVVW
ncbi:head-tail connector protein [Lacticaseibacillus saniviri]|uniref:Uncharacterized protein n=1 Tax=Lacticaseibacillus saniviri JCM 17471 = DSM 24301 TaxID=1293598 RepID=A0A0R2N0V7_9LACO|nr:hypothetical protein [Lacticaseibacillus saniviri]KRO16634.1 hypothetical protein IV56_GL001079 [Lacticaseibacillus saniviri JCM 17471 = DSM 24301]